MLLLFRAVDFVDKNREMTDWSTSTVIGRSMGIDVTVLVYTWMGLSHTRAEAQDRRLPRLS